MKRRQARMLSWNVGRYVGLVTLFVVLASAGGADPKHEPAARSVPRAAALRAVRLFSASGVVNGGGRERLLPNS